MSVHRRIKAKTKSEYSRLCGLALADWRGLAESLAPGRVESLIVTYGWKCKRCGSENTSFRSFPQQEGPISSHEAMRLARAATVGACGACLDNWADGVARRSPGKSVKLGRTRDRSDDEVTPDTPEAKGEDGCSSVLGLIFFIALIWWLSR